MNKEAFFMTRVQEVALILAMVVLSLLSFSSVGYVLVN